MSFKNQEGKEIKIPIDGSLGLLSTGYKGLMAWRTARQEAGYDLIGIKKNEWEEMEQSNKEKKALFEQQKKEFLDKKNNDKDS